MRKHVSFKLGHIEIAKIIQGHELTEWYLFLPHEEVHRQGGRGPYDSFDAAKIALVALIPSEAQMFITEEEE